MEYHDRVKFWIVMGPLWSIALAGLTGISILPADFDVFYHDTYAIVAKSHVILATPSIGHSSVALAHYSAFPIGQLLARSPSTAVCYNVYY
jgi:heme/copper-type cytochrome/quinol oxidase subunit 1